MTLAYNRNVLQQIVMDDVAQKMQMGRAAIAMGNGLDPNTYVRAFPVSSNTTINITSPAQDAQGVAQPAAESPATQTPVPPEPPPVTQPTTPAATPDPVAIQPPVVPPLTPADLCSTTPGTLAKAAFAGVAMFAAGAALTLGYNWLNRAAAAPATAAQQPADTGARVRIFWGEQEIKPANPASATITEGTK